jgi:hypothetical protein
MAISFLIRQHRRVEGRGKSGSGTLALCHFSYLGSRPEQDSNLHLLVDNEVSATCATGQVVILHARKSVRRGISEKSSERGSLPYGAL